MKVARQKARRLKLKVNSLKGIIRILKDKNLISTRCEDMLKQCLSEVPFELLTRIKKTKSGKGFKYSAALKSFALTLQFYSSKAYEFVRKSFDFSLPHQAQIRKWYGKIDADPGFTKPAFIAIKEKVRIAHNNGKQVMCSLMLDEMSIRKHIAWDGKKFRGFVDHGNGLYDDDSLPYAKDVLVLMVVCINSGWKVPCAYFFVDGLSGAERANIVKICIQRVSYTGAKVVSLTCDGPSCHFTMLRELGASMIPGCLTANFEHPSNKTERIYVLLDVCHMLKLVRNTFADWGILVDGDGGKIKWQYIIALQKLQQNEGLRLGNKLKLAHIKWQQQKMKVNLAAQALSSSVADAIQYCAENLKLKEFKGCAPTVRFLRMFDRLFDILNSRNPLAKGFKSALRIANKFVWDPFLSECFTYIMQLKTTDSTPMHISRRKTGFVGFLACIQSTKGLFDNLVGRANAPLSYLLMYKFSQDHLELFFSAVRTAGGCNNNPTAQQFTAAFKRLLMRSCIKGTNGNCSNQDSTTILDAISDTCKTNYTEVKLTDVALIKKYDLIERLPISTDHDYCDSPNIKILSEYKKAAITYIAGYVAKMAKKQTTCFTCSLALGSQKMIAQPSFLTFKDRGGLMKPSESVIRVCSDTEKCFLRLLACSGGKLPINTGIPDAIATSVLHSINASQLFPDLDSHMFDSTVMDNHVFQLIKVVSKCYSKIRLYHLGKETSEKIVGEKIRKKLSKLVLFNNQ